MRPMCRKILQISPVIMRNRANETADQYKSSNNISKQQETKEVIKEFKTIVIYVPEKNPSTAYACPG